MLCKKCGANIEENSKFCGYCGNKVETVEINNPFDSNLVNEDIEKTTVIEPVIQNDINNELSVENTIINNETPVQNIIVNNEQINTVNNIEQGPANDNKTTDKKNNKLVFIIGGIILSLIAIVLVIFAVMKSSNSTISVFKKALANLEERASGSLTLDAKLLLETPNQESLTFSANIKMETENENNSKFQLTVNKSKLFDEINIYGLVDNNNFTLYTKSNLVDMLGFTNSLNPIWLYYSETITDDEFNKETLEIEEMNIIDFIDEEHFIFIDGENSLRHYQLIIDQKLIDSLKEKTKDIEDEDIKEMFESIENFEQTIKVDFYINKSNELVKIILDLTPYLESIEEISKIQISFEFSGLNSTKIEIPSEVKESNVDLETYLKTYYNLDNMYDENLEYDMNVDYDTTIDPKLNKEMFDTSFDNTIYSF